MLTLDFKVIYLLFYKGNGQTIITNLFLKKLVTTISYTLADFKLRVSWSSQETGQTLNLVGSNKMKVSVIRITRLYILVLAYLKKTHHLATMKQLEEEYFIKTLRLKNAFNDNLSVIYSFFFFTMNKIMK